MVAVTSAGSRSCILLAEFPRSPVAAVFQSDLLEVLAYHNNYSWSMVLGLIRSGLTKLGRIGLCQMELGQIGLRQMELGQIGSGKMELGRVFEFKMF